MPVDNPVTRCMFYLYFELRKCIKTKVFANVSIRLLWRMVGLLHVYCFYITYRFECLLSTAVLREKSIWVAHDLLTKDLYKTCFSKSCSVQPDISKYMFVDRNTSRRSWRRRSTTSGLQAGTETPLCPSRTSCHSYKK